MNNKWYNNFFSTFSSIFSVDSKNLERWLEALHGGLGCKKTKIRKKSHSTNHLKWGGELLWLPQASSHYPTNCELMINDQWSIPDIEKVAAKCLGFTISRTKFGHSKPRFMTSKTIAAWFWNKAELKTSKWEKTHFWLWHKISQPRRRSRGVRAGTHVLGDPGSNPTAATSREAGECICDSLLTKCMGCRQEEGSWTLFLGKERFNLQSNWMEMKLQAKNLVPHGALVDRPQ